VSSFWDFGGQICHFLLLEVMMYFRDFYDFQDQIYGKKWQLAICDFLLIGHSTYIGLSQFETSGTLGWTALQFLGAKVATLRDLPKIIKKNFKLNFCELGKFSSCEILHTGRGPSRLAIRVVTRNVYLGKNFTIPKRLGDFPKISNRRICGAEVDIDKRSTAFTTGGPYP